MECKRFDKAYDCFTKLINQKGGVLYIFTTDIDGKLYCERCSDKSQVPPMNFTPLYSALIKMVLICADDLKTNPHLSVTLSVQTDGECDANDVKQFSELKNILNNVIVSFNTRFKLKIACTFVNVSLELQELAVLHPNNITARTFGEPTAHNVPSYAEDIEDEYTVTRGCRLIIDNLEEGATELTYHEGENNIQHVFSRRIDFFSN